MSGQGAKLVVAFAVSLVLHGAGLWAVAARIEPRQAAQQGEVEIVDRELFFRHAPARRVARTQPVSESRRLGALDAQAAVPARPAAEAVAPADAESLSPAAATAARQHTPERRLASTTDAATAQRIAGAAARPPQQAPERIGPDREADRVEPVEAQDNLAAALPGQRLVAAPPEPGLARADPVAEAQPAEVSTSLSAALADDRITPARTRPQVAPPVTVRPQAPATSAEEIVEAVRDDPPPARPAAPVAVVAESPEPSRARVAARRLAPEPASPEAVVVARRSPDADAAPPTAPGTAQPAPPGLVLAPRGGDPEPPQALAATPAARSSSPPTIRPPTIRPSARQAPVDTPAATPAPASDVATAQARPLPPERLAALGPEQVVESDAAAGTPPAAEPARLSPASPTSSAPVARAEPAEPSAGAPAVIAPDGALRVGALPHAQRMAPASPQTDAPAARTGLTISPVPVAPEAPEAPSRAPQRLAAIDPVDRFTRSYRGGECFFAVRTAATEDAGFVSYAAQLQSVLNFKQAFAQALDMEPSVGWQHVTDAQCTGISFARVILGNRAPSLAIALENKEIMSGSALSARLPDQPFSNVAVLLLDDDGLVHNISSFLRSGPDGLELFVPELHATGDGKRRNHLLIAISASIMLPALESTEPAHADDFFAQLLEEVRAADADVELGLDHFVVF